VLADLWTIIAIFMVNATILILMISNKFYNDFNLKSIFVTVKRFLILMLKSKHH